MNGDEFFSSHGMSFDTHICVERESYSRPKDIARQRWILRDQDSYYPMRGVLDHRIEHHVIPEAKKYLAKRWRWKDGEQLSYLDWLEAESLVAFCEPLVKVYYQTHTGNQVAEVLSAYNLDVMFTTGRLWMADNYSPLILEHHNLKAEETPMDNPHVQAIETKAKDPQGRNIIRHKIVTDEAAWTSNKAIVDRVNEYIKPDAEKWEKFLAKFKTQGLPGFGPSAEPLDYKSWYMLDLLIAEFEPDSEVDDRDAYVELVRRAVYVMYGDGNHEAAMMFIDILDAYNISPIGADLTLGRVNVGMEFLYELLRFYPLPFEKEMQLAEPAIVEVEHDGNSQMAIDVGPAPDDSATETPPMLSAVTALPDPARSEQLDGVWASEPACPDGTRLCIIICPDGTLDFSGVVDLEKMTSVMGVLYG